MYFECFLSIGLKHVMEAKSPNAPVHESSFLIRHVSKNNNIQIFASYVRSTCSNNSDPLAIGSPEIENTRLTFTCALDKYLHVQASICRLAEMENINLSEFSKIEG